MKEVSSKVLDVHFRAARKKGIPFTEFVQGTSCSVAQLLKHERMDWGEYVQVMANASRVFTQEELVAHGGAFFRTSVFRPMAIVARLLFTCRDLYRWLNGSDKGLGNQFFTCIRPRYRETGTNGVTVELTMEEGYSPCWEFFVITKGSMIDLPRLIGLRPAQVELSQIPGGARYDVTYPLGGGALAFLRKAVSWPFTVRAAARELKEAHEALRERYYQLEEARAQVQRQATQLKTAHSISQVVHGELDLDRTLHALASALTEVAGFAAADVRIATTLEGTPVAKIARAGVQAPEGEALARRLESHGAHLGELLLWPRSEAERTQAEELLTYVVPVVTMAIDNALAFTAVADYRDNLERKVVARTAELKEANDRLNETVQNLKSAQSTQQRIFSNINHEIRTPLSLITFAVSTVKRRERGNVSQRTLIELDGIEDSVKRLLNLVDNLLLLAAGSEGKLRLQLQQRDLGATLAALVRTWRASAEEAGLVLTYQGPASCPAIFDDAAVGRMATNLVSNAIKFTPSGGRIDVELLPGPEAFAISVRDTGIGIDEEFKNRIFKRFEQGRPAVRNGAGGSGIGLSIVRELALAHGGAVTVDSNPGGGSVFRLTLPRMSAVPAAAPPQDGSTISPPLPGGEVPGPRIESRDSQLLECQVSNPQATLLVAEDDPGLRLAVGNLLSHYYRVWLAPDGMTALRLAEEHHPNLLISDVGMPGMDGLELTRRFRELKGNRLAPVVLLTAYSGLGHRLSGFEAGAVDYVLKPVEPDELIARVRSQLALRNLALRLHEKEKLAALGVLSAGLAHGIRNPANALVNALAPLCESLPANAMVPGSAAAQLFGVVEECAQRIARLSQDLLGLARPGLVEYREETVQRLVTRARAALRERAYPVKVIEELQYDGPVMCAAPLLLQVLTNLLENGMDAAGEGGWVKVKSLASDGRLRIEVSDSGAGVPRGIRERIFDPFFTTKPPGAGTGLGLTISRVIAEEHHGSLAVVDTSTGSAFCLDVPLRPQELGSRPNAVGTKQVGALA